MPEFSYTALTRDGKEVSSRKFAQDKETLIRTLKKRQLLLHNAKEIQLKKIPQKALKSLISELSDLLESGIMLERSLQIVAEDNENEQVAQLASRLRNALKGGHSLSHAFTIIGQTDPLVVPLINAGEISGKLPYFLTKLNTHFEDRAALQQEVAASLAYPAILMVVSLLSIIGLGIYVIPVFKEIFEDDMGSLPLGTRIVFMFSDWLVLNGWVLPLILIGIVLAVAALQRASYAIRYNMDLLLLRMPFAGRLLVISEAAKLTSILGILLISGLPLVKALEITHKAISNRAIACGLRDATQDIRQGRAMSGAIEHLPHFPSIASRLIKIGDESGNLGEATAKAGHILERSLKQQLKSLVSMLEPLIILTMGGLVGFVVISMLLAVFSMSDMM